MTFQHPVGASLPARHVWSVSRTYTVKNNWLQRQNNSRCRAISLDMMLCILTMGDMTTSKNIKFEKLHYSVKMYYCNPNIRGRISTKKKITWQSTLMEDWTNGHQPGTGCHHKIPLLTSKTDNGRNRNLEPISWAGVHYGWWACCCMLLQCNKNSCKHLGFSK